MRITFPSIIRVLDSLFAESSTKQVSQEYSLCGKGISSYCTTFIQLSVRRAFAVTN